MDEIFTGPWYPWYPDDIDESENVEILTLAEEGAYRIALDKQWKRGSMPSDPGKFAAVVGKRCTAKMAKKIIGLFFRPAGQSGRVVNKKLESVRAEQAEIASKSKIRAQKAAQTRWKIEPNKNGGANATSNANAMLADCKGLNKKKEEEIRKEKEEELREAQASPLPLPQNPADTLEHHPLISGINAVAGRYPPKEIWDDLTGQVGANVDQAKLKTCFTKWRARGFNPQNFQGWAVDWYLHGIPEINAMEKRSNGTTQPKTFRQQRNDEAKREGEFLEELRRSVANGTAGVLGNDPADSQRRLLAGVTDTDPG